MCLVPTELPGISPMMFNRGSHVAGDSVFQQGLNKLEVSEQSPNYGSKDLGRHNMDVPGPVVKTGRKQTKEEIISNSRYMFPIALQDARSKRPSPGNENEDHGMFASGQASISSESYKKEKKSREFKTTSR